MNKIIKVPVTILTTLVFVFAEGAVLLSFISEIEFDKAQYFEKNYRWRKAKAAYQKTTKINPFNSEYLSAYADFLLTENAYLKEKIPPLEKAQGLYEKASNLNPKCAKYYYDIGKTQLEMYRNILKYMEMDGNTLKLIEEAFGNFGKAVCYDPNGFNTSYLIGYNGIKVFRHLNKTQKDLISDRLKYILELQPWYGKYVYPELWRNTEDFEYLQYITPANSEGNKILYNFIEQNDLLQFRRKQKKILDFYLQKEKPAWHEEEKDSKKRLLRTLRVLAMTGQLENWTGESKYGKNVYKNGNMYWTGTINKAINMPKGDAIIKIPAKGTTANDIWPYMIVELDGEEIGEIFVDSAEWKEYGFEVNTEGGIKVLSVTFANDKRNMLKNEDRNLYIGTAKVEGY